MSTDITEASLSGVVFLEVADNTTATVTWVDVSPTLSYANASRGGRVQPPGESQTETGILTAGFVDLPTTISTGYWVRLRVSTHTVWAGYVQNVDTVTKFDGNYAGGRYILTNIICADWVGIASSAIIEGNATSTTGLYDTVGNLIGALNDSYAAGYDLISTNLGLGGMVSFVEDADTIAGHLDEIGESVYINYPPNGVQPMRWHSTKAVPTTSHPPAGALLANWFPTGSQSTGLAFTDVAGGTDLHYTDITVASSTREMVNSVEVSNQFRTVASSNPKLRVVEKHTETVKDSASITANGERRATVKARRSCTPEVHGVIENTNLVWNPNVQESSQYWVVDNSALSGCRRFAPSREATPFNAFEGDYAMRRTVLTATSNVTIMYAHDNEEGIPVTAGHIYRFVGRGARYSSLTDLQIRADLIWYDDNSAVISTVSSSQVALTSIRTWYAAGISGTAPANAVSAKVRLVYTRSGGANLTVGSKLYADGYHVYRVANTSESIPYLSGDTEDTATYLYAWLGDPYRSNSGQYFNEVHTLATNILTYAANGLDGVRSLRWNAQESIGQVQALDINKTITVTFDGATATYIIVGLEYELSPSRLMANLYLRKAS